MVNPKAKKKRRDQWLRDQLKIFRCRIRRRFLTNTKVVGITGSCGKTSTTHFLGKIISDYYPCQIGVDNNTRRAVIRNIRETKRCHRFLVQETGVKYSGDMAGMIPLLLPDIGVLTTIGQDHYTSFRTLEATAAEKVRLIESLPAKGTAVLNADDPHVLAMAQKSRCRVLTYGLSEIADVRAADIRSDWPKRLTLTVSYQGETVRIETGLFGKLLTTSVLAAIAGALAAGMDLTQCARSLKSIETGDRRMSIHLNPSGIWFINDTFKAPYWSLENVISQLETVEAPRKTLVLGSFSDTPGSDSPKYRRIAKKYLDLADRIILTGEKSIHIRKMITPELKGRLFAFESVKDAYNLLADTAVKDELVLVKSNGLPHLERLIHGHLDGFSCWKNSCKRQDSCERCEESGLVSL